MFSRIQEYLSGKVQFARSSSGLQIINRIQKSESVRAFPYWFIPFFMMGLAIYGGLGWSTMVSFTDYTGYDDPQFTQLDLEMYSTAIQDPELINAFVNNLIFLLSFTTISLLLGLILALLLDRGVRFKEKFQTIYLLPMALSFVVTAQIWLWVYNPTDGLLNTVLGLFNIGPFNWIGNPNLILGAIVFAFIWQFTGYCMVVFYAGLTSISNDQFEAAMIDGASTVKTYWEIIVPQLKPASVSAAVVVMVFGLRTFTFLYAMFGQYRVPPETDILGTLVVREAFKFQNWAYASAIGNILIILAISIITPYFYYQYKQGSL